MSVPSFPSVDYEYIHIEPDFFVARKTGRWLVYNSHHGSLLGVIEWSGTWRQYVFFPEPETQWSAGCLEDVAEFMRKNRAFRIVPTQSVAKVDQMNGKLEA